MREQTAVNATGVVYYLHGDHLGGTNMVTSQSGQKVGEMRCMPFGETRSQSGDTQTDRLFTGQRSEAQGFVGSLMDFMARTYSSVLGRFLSADTIVPSFARPQSLNRYSYVENRPLIWDDPTGHCPTCMTGKTPEIPSQFNTVQLATVTTNTALTCDVSIHVDTQPPPKQQAEIRPLPTTIEHQMIMKGDGASLLTMVGPLLAALAPETAVSTIVGGTADAAVQLANDGKVNPDQAIQAGLINAVGGKVEAMPLFKAFGPAAKPLANMTSNIVQGGLSATASCLSGQCPNVQDTMATNGIAGPVAPIVSFGLKSVGVRGITNQVLSEVAKSTVQRTIYDRSRPYQTNRGGSGQRYYAQ